MPEVPLHRRGIQVLPPVPRLAAGSVFSARDQRIEFASGFALDFNSSQTWEAAGIPCGNLVESRLLPGRLQSFGNAFLPRNAPAGFGRCIQPVLQIANGQEATAGIKQDEALLGAAWSLIEKIARACLVHDLTAVLQQAEAIVGLGEGLTPSGDDFLGGLFFCRHLLSCAYPQLAYLECAHLMEWVEACRSHTNSISFTLLKDNALGYAPEPLSHFGAALLNIQSGDQAGSAAANIINLGHSTGWDLLTGFLVGLLLTVEN